jgi:molecular chaperone GrpE
MDIKDQQSASDGPLSRSEEAVVEQGNGAEAEALTEAAEASPVDLQEQLDQQQRQSEEYLDHLQRLQAEFSNYRRRVSQEQLQAASRGKEEVLRALLPILGNFRLALQHAEEDANAVRQGVQMIWQQFESFLREQRVEPVATIGQPFDPTKHEALSTAPATAETPANTIVAEINAGYLVDGRLLRPAQVVVARAEEASEAAASEEPPPTPRIDMQV